MRLLRFVKRYRAARRKYPWMTFIQRAEFAMFSLDAFVFSATMRRRTEARMMSVRTGCDVDLPPLKEHERIVARSLGVEELP